MGFRSLKRVDAFPPDSAEVGKRLVTYRHLHPEPKGVR